MRVPVKCEKTSHGSTETKAEDVSPATAQGSSNSAYDFFNIYHNDFPVLLFQVHCCNGE